jgi:hypothetical protein
MMLELFINSVIYTHKEISWNIVLDRLLVQRRHLLRDVLYSESKQKEYTSWKLEITSDIKEQNTCISKWGIIIWNSYLPASVPVRKEREKNCYFI